MTPPALLMESKLFAKQLEMLREDFYQHITIHTEAIFYCHSAM